ncbi:hypothetical protein [Bowmanella denitrificans]|uniref:hypothetical protein n=1 Tax=Bowmanella denitrificans TaxID=366582 RepID=UPI000C9B4794|nr:hypothetical protein [Bowmanella denitrificans]
MLLPWGLYHIVFVVTATVFLFGLQDDDLLLQFLSSIMKEEIDVFLLEQIVFFNLLIFSLLWASFYFRGVCNRATVIDYGLMVCLFNVMFFGLHVLVSELQLGLYFKIPVGVFSMLICAQLFKKRQILRRWLAWKLQHIAPSIASFLIKSTMPTHFEFRMNKVVKWYVALEVIYFIYMVGYTILMGIPNSGSIADTEEARGHAYSLIIYTVLYQIVGLIYFVELTLAIKKDWKQPDFLF